MDSSSSMIPVAVSPPSTPLANINPVNGGEKDKASSITKSQTVIMTTPTLSFAKSPVIKTTAIVKTEVTDTVKPAKYEPVGVALTRTSHRQIKRPKTDEELIDFESSSRSGSGSKKAKTASKTATVKCYNNNDDNV